MTSHFNDSTKRVADEIIAMSTLLDKKMETWDAVFASRLDGLVVSDTTGSDDKSQQLLGKRYDLDADKLAAVPETAEQELIQVANTVLARLKQTAASEAQ